MIQEKYLNPFTDFGFKKIFGEEPNLKVYWDIHAVIETAKDDAFDEGKVEGKIQGKIEGKIEVAKNLISLRLDNETIVKATGLTIEEVDSLRKTR
jgi:predicted transposase/invertase (TIGR01784 family)